MNKIDLKVIPSVNISDIQHFIIHNSHPEIDINNRKLDSDYWKVWRECNDIFVDELYDIQSNFPDQIEMVDTSERISKVIVSELIYDGWIKKFTETQELKEDYYILFTD